MAAPNWHHNWFHIDRNRYKIISQLLAWQSAVDTGELKEDEMSPSLSLFMETLSFIFSPRKQTPRMKIQNYPRTTCQMPLRKVAMPTLPGTQLFPNSHEYGYTHVHPPLPLRLSCTILYGRPITLSFQIYSRN